jgi:serine/threonine protein kinase
MRFLCKHCSELIKAKPEDYGTEMTCPDCQGVLTVPTKKTDRGALIDDYLVLEPLGEGGFATVYRAHQLSLDRDVALKVVTKDRIEDVMEFVNEARNAAKLTHPNIVQAYAVGNDGQYYFIAMEIVKGENVGEMLIGHKTMKPASALRIIKDVAAALHYSWSTLHILHRDIKPNNIMIRDKDGLVKLADFGLALNPNQIDHHSETVPGTVEYICPEALTGDPVDIRGDIYSLGASLYRMITGKLPHPGKDAMEIAKLQVRAPTPDPRDIKPDLPELVVQICMKMMAKDPEDRYLDAQSLLLDLEEALRSPMRDKPAFISKEPEPEPEPEPVAPPPVAGMPDAATLKMGLRNLKTGGESAPAPAELEPAPLETAESASPDAEPPALGADEDMELAPPASDAPTIAPPSGSAGLRLKREPEPESAPAPSAAPPPAASLAPPAADAPPPPAVKKSPPPAAPATSQPVPPAAETTASSGGGLGKIIAIVIVLGLLVGGGWWFKNRAAVDPPVSGGDDPPVVEQERPTVGGWTPNAKCELSVVDNMLQAEGRGSNGAMMAEVDLAPQAYVVELELRSSQAGVVRVAWLSSERQKFAGTHMKTQEVSAGDSFNTFRFLMEDSAQITRLAILPAEGSVLALRAVRVRDPGGSIAKQWGGTTATEAIAAAVGPDSVYELNTAALPAFSVSVKGRATSDSSGTIPSGWAAFGDARAVVTVALVDEDSSGSPAIRIATTQGKPGAAFYRNRIVPLLASKKYEIRFRYRTEGAARADFTFSGNRLPEQTRELDSGGQWKEFRSTFTPNQESTIGVRWRNLSQGPLYLQNFRLLEH